MQSIDQKASRSKEMQLVSSSIFKAPSYRTVKMILILVSDFVYCQKDFEWVSNDLEDLIVHIRPFSGCPLCKTAFLNISFHIFIFTKDH